MKCDWRSGKIHLRLGAEPQKERIGKAVSGAWPRDREQQLHSSLSPSLAAEKQKTERRQADTHSPSKKRVNDDRHFTTVCCRLARRFSLWSLRLDAHRSSPPPCLNSLFSHSAGQPRSDQCCGRQVCYRHTCPVKRTIALPACALIAKSVHCLPDYQGIRLIWADFRTVPLIRRLQAKL